jgi:hypothetical protein
MTLTLATSDEKLKKAASKRDISSSRKWAPSTFV